MRPDRASQKWSVLIDPDGQVLIVQVHLSSHSRPVPSSLLRVFSNRNALACLPHTCREFAAGGCTKQALRADCKTTQAGFDARNLPTQLTGLETSYPKNHRLKIKLMMMLMLVAKFLAMLSA